LKIGFVSLGCPKNLVDSEVMMGQLTARGHQLTSTPEEADAIVVNTCGFINPAQQESVDTILEMARFKQDGRARRLIVTGCLVERFRADIRSTLPDVDAVIGTNELDSIVDACEGSAPAAAPAVPYLYSDSTPRVRATPRHYAYLKINEGCDHPCSFCVIPQFRGSFRSRTLESVEAEARALLSDGVRELILIGQDTTAFGDDLGMKDGLPTLLERLAQLDAPGPYWVRFLYCYPNRISRRLLDVLATGGPLVPYIDMPLQHASAPVLKRMKRGGSGEVFLKTLDRIRRAVPGVAIRTSMIAGFPGETENDFEELCQFVEAARFDRLGVFAYSDEETAPSFHLDGKVPRRDIYNRRRHLMSLQRRISKSVNRALVGRELPVLLEGPSPDSELVWQARLATQAPDIDGVCYVSDCGEGEPRQGEFRRMKIRRAHDYDLVGDLVDTPAPANPFRIIGG